MQITVVTGTPEPAAKSVRAMPVFEGDKPTAHAHSLAAGVGFKGALNELMVLPDGKHWVILAGLGKPKQLTLDRIRQFAGTAAKAARNRGFATLVLPAMTADKVGGSAEAAQALIEGALLGLYRYDRLKKPPKADQAKRLEAITLTVERKEDVASATRGAKKGQVLAEAVTLVRDLITGPSNIVTPTHLAEQAQAIAKAHKLKCLVIPFPELKRQGFGGLVAVAQGSAHPAQFIVLEYQGAKSKATIALCGKGITFDSGGISIKPSAKMEQMKYDMSGAAAVLGTLQAAAELKLPVHLIGIIAATENLPSGTAQKPGDVITTLSGKTVEVLNTDAEGRLVLADCLHYAKRYKPHAVIDLATLTGACVVALGTEAIGLMSTDNTLAQRILESGQRTRERAWRLPLWDEYGGRLINSDIADLKNVSNTGEAGTITAGKFLEQFVDGAPWAHLDIAGTAWTDRDKPYVPKGAVGVGVRLLIDLLERWEAMPKSKTTEKPKDAGR